MRRFRTIQGSITAATAGFAALQAPTQGTALTLATSAAPAATAGQLLPNAVPVTLTSTANLSAGTYTVVGLDRRGSFLSEVITGPNNNTVTGHLLFGTVSSITPNTTSASTVSAGWAGTNYGPWLYTGFCKTSAIARALSGTPTYGIQLCTQNILDPTQFLPDGGGGMPSDGKSGSPVYANGNWPLVSASLQTAAPWLLSTSLALPEDDGTWSGPEYAPNGASTATLPAVFQGSAAGPAPTGTTADFVRLDPHLAFAWRLVVTSTAGLAQLDLDPKRC